MGYILNFDTSTRVCSVGLSDGEKCVSYIESCEEYNHASQLTVLIGKTLSEAGIGIDKLDAVAVCKGPGSYTGLRIGVSTAKGICYAAGLPLIALNTLQVMTQRVISEELLNEKPEYGNDDVLLCPMIDARRMEVYMSLFNTGNNQVSPTTASIISPDSFKKHLETHKIVFFGDGAEKCKVHITDKNARFIDDIYPIAKHMAGLSYKYFIEKKFEDLAYFEPFYLKEFVTTTPKNKVL